MSRIQKYKTYKGDVSTVEIICDYLKREVTARECSTCENFASLDWRKQEVLCNAEIVDSKVKPLWKVRKSGYVEYLGDDKSPGDKQLNLFDPLPAEKESEISLYRQYRLENG